MLLTDPCDFWINVAGPMESGDAAGSSRSVPPSRRQSKMNREKAGVALLFSGVFLAMVGIAFSAVGLKDFQKQGGLEWTRLMGPVMISLGVTFILTSIHKFGILSCWPCRRQREDEEEEEEEEVYVIPRREQNSHQRPSFVFHGINQPVVLQGAAAMLCIPPAYNFMAADLQQAVEFQPGVSVSGGHAALPSYDSIFNGAEAGGSATGPSSDHRGRSVQKTEEERRRSSADSTCSRPPAYEDVYPSSQKRHSS